uniref:Transmembrane protein n=1 Tax=Caenorhabditis tropicalis TaxID=1561998 RepID=A0A1I7TD84_9PELO
MISPPTSLQVLVAFLSSGELLEDRNGTICCLIFFCGAQFWIIIAFCICVFQPGFSLIRQYWFLVSTVVLSIFETGTTLKPGARLKNSCIFASNGTLKNLEIGEKPSNTDSRSTAGAEEYTKLDSDYIAGSSSSKEDMSYITNYEEHLTEKMATMKRWEDRQEVPVDNSATYLLGDQTKLNSSLLKTISEMNPKEQFGFVPFVDCLPTLYTPFELLENVSICHGYEISEEQINYLLNIFNMKSIARTRIDLLS